MSAQEASPDASIVRRYRELEDEHDDLLYAFSHDFGASLRQTKQFARLLLKRVGEHSDAESRRLAALMEQAIERSEDMVDGVLELSRATAGKSVPAPVDCVPIVAETLSPFMADDVSLTFSGPGSVIVLGNAGQLRDLFHRLVDNAVRYRRPGEPLEVRLSAEPLGTGWRFEIHDNGSGFSTDRLDDVFRLFRNIDSSERNTRVGLGLPICRAIVRRHDGDIRCECGARGDTSLAFTLGASLPPRSPVRMDRPAEGYGRPSP